MTTPERPPIRVLMVCLGNICRSPTAEVVFRQQVQVAGLSHVIDVDSAGTSDWHKGEAPDQRSLRAAANRLYDLSSLCARQVQPRDFEEFDYIFAMDKQNLAVLEEMCPVGHEEKLGLLLDYGNTGWTEVPDPYNAGPEGFELVLDLVETACAEIVDVIRARHDLDD
jgi:protein-tyrosine phosphatase